MMYGLVHRGEGEKLSEAVFWAHSVERGLVNACIKEVMFYNYCVLFGIQKSSLRAAIS